MKSKKRILLVSCGGLGNGGVQAIMMGLVRSLSDKFIFDVLLFTSEVRHYDEEFLSYGGDIIRIPHYEGSNKYLRAFDFYTRDLLIYRKLRQILKKRPTYTAIHCNKEYESAPIIKAAYECGIPVRICHNHILNQKGGILCQFLNRVRLRYIKRYATLLIGCSDESCRSIYGEEGYIVMNNFYDDHRFNPLLFKETDNKSLLSIVQVGALSSNKNQIFSVKVLSEIRKRNIDAKLTLIGFELEDGYKDKILQEVERLRLTSCVDLLPGDTNIPKKLSESDVFLMPSIKEGFGIALIEAQSMGLRCFASSSIPLTTNCGGVSYHGLEDGAYFWAEAIEKYISDGIDKASLYDTEKFKVSRISNMYEKLYLNNNENTYSW